MKNPSWYQTFKVIHGSEESFMKDVTVETNLKRAKKLLNKLRLVELGTVKHSTRGRL